MDFRMGVLAIFLATCLVWFGCEGPEGSQGEQGPQGPQGPGAPVLTYLGDDGNTCSHCHGSKVNTWHGTSHSEAYAALAEAGNQDNPYCLQCHTVGFDSPVASGDTTITVHGPDLTGFDDYWPPQTADDSARIDILQNVQCESCHGPMGPTIYDHAPEVSFDTRIENGVELSPCATCHSEVAEWHQSGHGTVMERLGMTVEEFTEEWGTSTTCAGCHTAAGFAISNDPALSGWALPVEADMVGCVACHDPHNAANEKQLRNLDDFSVIYDANQPATFTGYGPAQVCVQCHHARRSVTDVEEQIQNGDDHLGPHPSDQMDMFLGTGCYEIPDSTYSRSHPHQGLTESCVTCHMTDKPHVDPPALRPGHDFVPSVAACQGCHPELTEEGFFDHNGGQTEISNLMFDLITAIGVPVDSLGSPTATTVEQRMAGYAYVFVADDGSRGVHNPTYARNLLETAIHFINAANAQAQSKPLTNR